MSVLLVPSPSGTLQGLRSSGSSRLEFRRPECDGNWETTWSPLRLLRPGRGRGGGVVVPPRPSEPLRPPTPPPPPSAPAVAYAGSTP